MTAFIDKVFKLKDHDTSIRGEFIAALSTWGTMSYIIFINPTILSKAGMDFGAVMVATIISMSFATMMMGFFARYPFALGPSMSLNSFFAYSLVLMEGLSWQTALAACLVSSVLLIILNILGVRQAIMEAIPRSLRLGTIAGIGLFLAFIGLRDAHIVTEHKITLVTMGSPTAPEALLTIAGVIFIASLSYLKIRQAFIITILFLWSAGIAVGLAEWKGVFSLPASLSPTMLQLDFSSLLSAKGGIAIVSLVFVSIFDAAGSLFSLCDQCHAFDEKGKIPRVRRALSCDAVGTGVAALLGSSPLTIYAESAAGIAAGGKTGLTSAFCGFLFLMCLFITPLASSIPVFASSAVLIVVGAMMARSIFNARFEDITDSLPAFLIMITIPLTYNISSGIGVGLIVYVAIKFFTAKLQDIHWLIWILAALFAIRFIFF